MAPTPGAAAAGPGRDTGLLHTLLGIRSLPQLLAWATHQGAELDLLMFKDERRIGVEFKRSDAPSITPSMRIALQDLKLDALYVVYPGSHRYRLTAQVEVVPLTALLV